MSPSKKAPGKYDLMGLLCPSGNRPHKFPLRQICAGIDLGNVVLTYFFLSHCHYNLVSKLYALKVSKFVSFDVLIHS